MLHQLYDPALLDEPSIALGTFLLQLIALGIALIAYLNWRNEMKEDKRLNRIESFFKSALLLKNSLIEIHAIFRDEVSNIEEEVNSIDDSSTESLSAGRVEEIRRKVTHFYNETIWPGITEVKTKHDLLLDFDDHYEINYRTIDFLGQAKHYHLYFNEICELMRMGKYPKERLKSGTYYDGKSDYNFSTKLRHEFEYFRDLINKLRNSNSRL